MRSSWRLSFLARLFSLLLLGALMAASAVPALADNGPDYAISGGRFFTETGGGGGNGYAVRDAGTDANGHTVRFWREFQRLGGVPTLGYPIGEPYVGSDGFIYQPFQRAVLQWRPELDLAFLSNTFEILSNNGKDSWLLTVKGVPMPIVDDGSNGNFSKAVTTRLGWLTNPAIKAKFLANPNPGGIVGWSVDRSIALYGLPMSLPEKHGPFISQRFQRISFQLWTDSVPGMPPPGSVVGILGGSLLNEAGLLPTSSTQPLGPNATSSIPTPTPPIRPAPRPSPVAPNNYPWAVSNVTNYPNCGTTYMFGYARDAGGNGVNGLAIKSWNDYGNYYTAGTSNYNGKDGYWDRVIGSGVRAGKWYVQVVDGAGNPASAVQVVNFSGSCDPSTNPANQVEVDFQAH